MGSPWVVSLGEMESGIEGTPFNVTGVREYVKKYKVVVNTKEVGPVTVARSQGIPLPFTPYFGFNRNEYDNRALLVRKSAKPEKEDDWQVWIVTCEYSSDLSQANGIADNGEPTGGADGGGGGNGGSGGDSSPEDQRPDYSWSSEDFMYAPPRDLKGKAFLNRARMPFSPAPTFPMSIQVFHISRSELSFDRKKAKEWSYAINSLPFMGANRGNVLCMPIVAKQKYEGPSAYWRVDYTLKFWWDEDTFDGWEPFLLNAGLCELQPIPNAAALVIGGVGIAVERPTPILSGGHPISQPVLLDINGKRAVQDPKTGIIEPNWISFTMHKKRDLNLLFSRGGF